MGQPMGGSVLRVDHMDSSFPVGVARNEIKFSQSLYDFVTNVNRFMSDLFKFFHFIF